MVATMTHPTPYPDVNSVLHRLLDEVRAILGPEFVGMYLYGSLSLGDFDPESSDIDFLVVTANELREETVHALSTMHARVAASGLKWADHLEGSYIPQAALRRYDPANNRHPTIGVDWEFGIREHDSNWLIERHIVWEHGIVVAGPPPQTLIDPVPPEAIRAAVLASFPDYWQAFLDGPHPERWQMREYQAFAILTMCRVLYVLAHDTVASKPIAAAWAQETLPPPWPTLIATALDWRHDTRPDDLTATLAFIRYTLERAGAMRND